jgi:hypothetical protein
LTAPLLCGVVYVILLDRLEAQVNAVLAAGGEVDPDEERALFDEALGAPFTAVDGDRFVLARALGVG